MVNSVRQVCGRHFAISEPVLLGGAVTRFVVLSFLFMGWAFYVLSGGADFEPRGMRPPKPVAQTAAADPKPAPAQQPVRTLALAAKPVIAPRKSRTTPARDTAWTETARAETTRTETTRAEQENAAKLDQVRSSLSQGLTQYSGYSGAGALGPITLTSLGQGAAGLATAKPETAPKQAPTEHTAPERDIREVTGTRVNMRDGPGTIYAVIARLNIGTQVEVLSESGTGWLRLRILPEQQVGWAAAALISKKAP